MIDVGFHFFFFSDCCLPASNYWRSRIQILDFRRSTLQSSWLLTRYCFCVLSFSLFRNDSCKCLKCYLTMYCIHSVCHAAAEWHRVAWIMTGHYGGQLRHPGGQRADTSPRVTCRMSWLFSCRLDSNILVREILDSHLACLPPPRPGFALIVSLQLSICHEQDPAAIEE